MASSIWDMRLSMACTATDMEFQNRIIIRDHTKNLPIPTTTLTAPHGAALARSRSAEPGGLSRPGTTVRSQPPQVTWEPVTGRTTLE